MDCVQLAPPMLVGGHNLFGVSARDKGLQGFEMAALQATPRLLGQETLHSIDPGSRGGRTVE